MTDPSESVVERLIEAAVQLFSRQGYRGTTTRQIAKLANVNETSLFRHFAHKQDLFWTALESRLKRLRIPRELRIGLLQEHPPETVLPLIVEFLVVTTMYQPELARLVWVSLLELRPDAEHVYRLQIEPIFRPINEYIQHCAASGSLRSSDSSLTTIALVATVLAHQGMHPMLGSKGQTYATADEAVRAYSRFWLDALTPIVDANQRPSKPRAGYNG